MSLLKSYRTLNSLAKKNAASAEYSWITACLLLGIGLRLLYLFASDFLIDSDEAIVGLMAKHMLETWKVPIFYYGQHYMGTLEPITAAVFFKLLGISSVVLHLVPLLWFALTQFFLYRLVQENMSSHAARISGLLFAIAPLGFIEWSTKARGGFIEIIFLGVFAFLFLFRSYRAKRVIDARRSMFIASFVVGIGWWVNNQIVYFCPAAALIYFLTFSRYGKKEFFRTALFSLFLFLLGGSPYWIYNCIFPGASFGMFAFVAPNLFGKQLNGIWEHAVPILLGGKRFSHEEQLFFHSNCVSHILLVVPIFLAIVALVLKKNTSTERLFVVSCLLTIGTMGAVFVYSSFGFLFLAPRYLLPFYAVFHPLVAYVLCSMPVKRGYQYLGLSPFVALALISIFNGGLTVSGQPLVYDGARVSKDNQEILTTLENEHISLIRTNYWIGYRIAFETKEAVKFVLFQTPKEARIRSYEQLVISYRQLLELPLLVVPPQAMYIREALKTLGISYRQRFLSGYVLFDRLSFAWLDHLQKIPVKDFKVTASDSSAEIPLMLDEDDSTRWASHRPQDPSMSIAVTFDAPIKLRMINLALGSFKSDYPRLALLYVIDRDGNERQLFSDSQSKSIDYFFDSMENTGFLLPPEEVSGVKIQQAGKDRLFDWSVAELRLFAEGSEPKSNETAPH